LWDDVEKSLPLGGTARKAIRNVTSRTRRYNRKAPSEELAKFREWFLDFDATQFDKRIDTDAPDGRLDSLADQADREHAAGKSKSL